MSKHVRSVSSKTLPTKINDTVAGACRMQRTAEASYCGNKAQHQAKKNAAFLKWLEARRASPRGTACTVYRHSCQHNAPCGSGSYTKAFELRLGQGFKTPSRLSAGATRHRKKAGSRSKLAWGVGFSIIRLWKWRPESGAGSKGKHASKKRGSKWCVKKERASRDASIRLAWKS